MQTRLKKDNRDVIPHREEDKAESERYAYCQETITLFTQTQIVYMALAQRLYDIKVNKLYLPFWESFSAYCIEMSEMSVSTRSRLLRLHERLVVEAGIPSEEVGRAGWSKVAAALPLIVDQESAEHWVGMAGQLNKTDFCREVKEAQTGRPMASCDHKDSYTIRICRTCGFKMRVYNENDVAE
jgi:hypothetical protein